MGTSSSHEVRQMVDETVVALRSGQPPPLPQQQQHRPFRRKQLREVIPLDDDIVVLDEGVVGGGNGSEGYYYIDYDTDGVWESDWSSDADRSACEECCCYSDIKGSECCNSGTKDCCASGRKKCGAKANNTKNKCKECEKMQKCRKCRKKGSSLWNRPKERIDWGGDVVGFSRRPGEKWGLKVDGHSDLANPGSESATHVCGGTCSCERQRRQRRQQAARHRTARGRLDDILVREDELQPQPSRRRTLLFDEFEVFPAGVSGGDRTEDGYQYHERDGLGKSRWEPRTRRMTRTRTRRDGSVDEEFFMMRGALGDSDRHRDLRDGGGRGGNRGRARSWERRSDLDERVGEIDDWSEGSSYAVGERDRLVVSRREEGGKRIVRFERA
ncbi:hypothetical protein CH63R_07442 [Colletotrichum higginsianum IMI 349063]|uniref:Uncharacterized protein n=1 Tax=Colletotrichum higginsianum (strain IMI 349063) TaxID=759273 RepID=A0A1B7Y9M9_COLHI|nr:hypothetical protein CH63R_07442 [Colletotrichum higginsianum IMI 349063]OBR08677.1 hypothetical protein CH63R_07442 [Colletotrichum higginsianum IMI 349063]GJC97255.1 hypothetical protein ColKHC_06081 [Colletotrichum higginsianum]